MALEALRLLDGPAAREAMRADFREVRSALAAPAAVSPAKAVLGALT
jgi:DNA-binding GntR family transcriptional regulator